MLRLNLPLRFEMWNILRLLLVLALPLFSAQELEVHLSTRSPLKRLYLAKSGRDTEQDWRYFDELQAVLAFDLDRGAFTAVAAQNEEWNRIIHPSDPRNHFDLVFWQRQQISYVVALQLFGESLTATVFNIEKGTSKRYPPLAVTGLLDNDRKSIHRLSDQIQKDLFGIAGIASQRLLYTQRISSGGKGGPEWLSDIWISDYDGANATRLTAFSGYCLSPGFLPAALGGKQGGYYFTSSDRGQSKIYRAFFGEQEPSLWIHLRGNQLLPAVASTGSDIAFISDAAGRPDLFIQHLGAQTSVKPRQIFSAPSATQASPTFSPDGKRVAFVSDKDGTARIYVMDIPDAKNTRRIHPTLISRKCRENTSPCWSPDGKKLAYSARTEGVRQIWIYQFGEDIEWQLTNGEENKENPSFAPDSLHLVYNTETNDVSELYLIDLSRQEPIKIGDGFGQKRFASWEMR